MARSKDPDQGKTRTREHVIADLAVNAVERHVLLRCFTMERTTGDYGYDASVGFFDDIGVKEPGIVFLQIKASDNVQYSADGRFVHFRLDRADLLLWVFEPSPVVLCVYDARRDVTYHLSLQPYFAALPGFNIFSMGGSITVHIPVTSDLTPAVVGEWREAVRALRNNR